MSGFFSKQKHHDSNHSQFNDDATSPTHHLLSRHRTEPFRGPTIFTPPSGYHTRLLREASPLDFASSVQNKNANRQANLSLSPTAGCEPSRFKDEEAAEAGHDEN